MKSILLTAFSSLVSPASRVRTFAQPLATGCIRGAVVDGERVRSSFPLKCSLDAAGLFFELVLEGVAWVSVVQEEVKCL